MTKEKQIELFEVTHELAVIEQIWKLLEPLSAEGKDRVMTYLESAVRKQVYFERIHGEEKE